MTMTKTSKRKKASPTKLKAILKRVENNKIYTSEPDTLEKVTKFLKKNSKILPHIIGALGAAYILREIYNTPEIHRKIIKFNMLHKVNVYKEIGITKNNTGEEIKNILSNCIFHGHPDRNNGMESKGFIICSELSQYLFNKKVKNSILRLIKN